MHPKKIPLKINDPTINIALHTLEQKKQALVFVNSRRSAEKQAEDIAKKRKHSNKECEKLSEQIRTIIPRPTKQCIRLAECVKKGIAFHHAGLHAKQKEIIEDEFRKGNISIICSTPTLAAGLDLPAFRAIIKNLKRYMGRFGMQYIPVLEYLQMAGRAGRPNFDTFGEGICIAKSESEAHEIYNKYVLGLPEEIYSKLAVEPVLRTYLLSLISSNFVSTDKEILDFFQKTFWAHQFKDMEKLSLKIQEMLQLLIDFEFITQGGPKEDFISASDVADNKYKPTLLGRRTSELYLDPLTAHKLIKALHKANTIITKEMSYLHLVCNTLEMRPRLRIRTKEWDDVQEKSLLYQEYFLENEPSLYEPDFEDFFEAVKTASMLNEWIEEKEEQYLLDTYNCAPGETRAKLKVADWLLMCCAELNKILGFQKLNKDLNKVRTRLKYGAKAELLPLLRLKGIGRMRARTLFRNKVKNLGDIKKVNLQSLQQLLGKNLGVQLKEQVGDIQKQVPKGKRKGQLGLRKYSE